MHVGSKTLASVNLKFSKLGKCNLHFLPRGLNIGLIKILRSCAYLVRYALRARRATKALRCFTILTLTLFLRCIFQIPPLRQPKDSGNAKMLVACLRVVSLRCQFFSDIFTKQPHPCPRKSLGWGVVAGSCWIVLKTAVKRDAVLCGATCRKIFVFPTYESVAYHATFNTNMMGVLV